MISLRYENNGSAIHALNPFVKLLWIACILVFALIFDHPIYVLALFLSTLPVVLAANIVRQWAGVMKLTLYLCAAIVVINALVSYHGSHVLFTANFTLPVLGQPAVTLEALAFGGVMALRLLAILSAFTVLTFTIHPDDFMLAMTKLKLPSKSVLVTALSTRFIPTLIEDEESISAVQKSRGLEFDRGNLFRRARHRSAVLLPLLFNSLDRAVQVAEAMEARAFGSGKGRSSYRELTVDGIDAVLLACGCFALALGIYMRAAGYGQFQFYPVLGDTAMSGAEWGLLIALAALLLIAVPLSYLKRRDGF